MAPNVHLDALSRAMTAELIQWGATDQPASSARWRTRALAAVMLGAATAVGAEEPASGGRGAARPGPVSATVVGGRVALPALSRPTTDATEFAVRALDLARWRVGSAADAVTPAASLALELGRLQRDLASRARDGMEEWIGEAYASLEAVRRAIGDAVVDDADEALLRDALGRAAELLPDAA